ncbi:hypothetical protein GE300_04725 [Rhodobacteraceae bacterium 2CG4]|uniref:Uncharacterized protein n=1 Tax=Halovulum marinum TaxID=2662447 RepID=A0A6L5YXG9_9RHOB|nr:hypothetical protein [Halovulum marinum]MSU88927.1 hypothetical protein [Halovulum marinum]
MIRGAAYLLATLAAAPVAASVAAAQDLAVIGACSGVPLDAGACDADALAAELGLLGPADVQMFRPYGMESFAILTALHYGASALYFAAEGEGCTAEEERAAAVEIWSLWVDLPAGVPQAVAERFAVYDGVMDNIIQMEVGC